MFTGIIETTGRVVRRAAQGAGAAVTIETPRPLPRVRRGESIAVNGACLTVTAFRGRRFTVALSPETLRCTTLARVAAGTRVNLERALRAGDRLGGHIVQGHVDAVGRLRAITPDGDWTLYRFVAPPALARYLVEKGSITVNGVSLTIFACRRGGFTVALIPLTLAVTTLSDLRAGDTVNLEADVLMKHVEALLRGVTPRRRRAPSPA